MTGIFHLAHTLAVLTRKQLRELRGAKAPGRNRVTQAMKLAGLTQVQLAQRLGVTQSYISKIANGQYRGLPGEMTHTLARFFGCAIEDLFLPAVTALVQSRRGRGTRKAALRGEQSGEGESRCF